MKKIFTLVALATFAFAANAQTESAFVNAEELLGAEAAETAEASEAVKKKETAKSAEKKRTPEKPDTLLSRLHRVLKRARTG